GILPPAGGGRRRSAAHSRHYLHREGGRQYADETRRRFRRPPGGPSRAGARMSGDVRFTASQLDAIDVAQRHRDACVVAGPGSGKTTVLVEYFRRLVEAGVDPLRILAITFTEKAAGNMRTKLAAAFDGHPAVRAVLERA